MNEGDKRKDGPNTLHQAASCESIEVFQAVLEHAQLLLQVVTILYGVIILGTEPVDLLVLKTPDHLRREPVPIVN